MNLSRAALVALCGFALVGCKADDVLNLRDLEAVAASDVWKDAALARAYGDRLYADDFNIGWSTAEANMSDEAPGATNFMYGQLTESSVNFWPYAPIRRINILLTQIDQGTLDPALVKTLKGEALFWRAQHYFDLVVRYGGVPLILAPQELTDDLLVERAPTSKVVAQIVTDLDAAIAKLPAVSATSGSNDGHAHKGTAMALKGRGLLSQTRLRPNR